MIQEQLLPETMVKENAITQLMKNYANYNFWANMTLVNWLKKQPLTLLEQEVKSSFKSVKATLIHILQTQEYWFSVISKTEFITNDYQCEVEELFDLFLQQSEMLANYINDMDAPALEESIFVQSPWFHSDFQNFEYVMQVFNHSTYHRGQIITICHNLGITGAPMTDYNYYNVNAR
ncbi:DinB family protein [Pedobacter punctiformis]|uniref:Damage-inducible protein DinB n=1 Tax=Pedobacter punctiformis TaxID=3004097 RepID=A0ABT4L4K1_9SPHI|nr:DinB family protein [Pedobacter sp. HCMS5-2]MCZ4242835.1 damage-inducible protein DinB [Pedobacter sp. HCMS5-2]